jgi:membrane associated rhomboid family serine protease
MKVRRFRSVEVVLVLLLNVAVFLHQQTLGAAKRMIFDDRYGAVPSVMWDAWTSFRQAGVTREVLRDAMPLVTANYLHADVAHIGANMLFFWIFANVVSETAGRLAFFIVYVLAGMIAVLVYVRTNPGSDIPMIGASGAIAGLEGAYFAFAFRWEMPSASVWPLDGPVPAGRLALVALLNFALDTSSFFGRSHDNVAYGAHVGGFLGGAIVAMIIASFYRPRLRAA